MVTIYSLSCPITKEVKYIGQTTLALDKRLSNHIYQYSTDIKKQWINGLINMGKEPLIEPIDFAFTKPDALRLEEYWIHQFIAWGFNLINISKNPMKYKLPKGGFKNKFLTFRGLNDNVRPNEIDSLMLRVLQVKAGWPINNYIAVWEAEYGALSDKDANLVRQVWNLKKTDEAITAKLEALKTKIAA